MLRETGLLAQGLINPATVIFVAEVEVTLNDSLSTVTVAPAGNTFGVSIVKDTSPNGSTAGVIVTLVLAGGTESE